MMEIRSEGKLPVKTKIAYAMGDMGNNILGQAVGFYYMYFLTDITLLTASLAGISLMLVRCIDAFTDPLIGYFSDRTRTRWGRRRPYLLFGSIACGLFFFLLFTYLPIKNQSLLFVHATMSYLLFYVSYSLVCIPYSALTPDMTQDYNERTNLTSYRMSFAILGIFIAAGLTTPLVSLFHTERIGYNVIAAIYGLAYIILIQITFLGVRENKVYMTVQHDKTPMMRLYLDTFKNRPFLMILIAYITIELATVLTSSTMIYYIKYYFKREDLLSTLLLTLFATALVCIPMWTMVSNRYGKKWSYFIGVGIFAVSMIMLFFIKPGNLLLLYVLTAIAGLGLSTEFVNPWAMMPDTIEYNEYMTGKRNEGIFYGMQSFCPKLASALAGLMVGWSLTLAHYVPNLVNQSPRTLLGIRIIFCLTPLFFTLLGMIAIGMYPITKKKYQEIMTELDARRSMAA